MEWEHAASPVTKKVVVTVFWVMQSVLLVVFAQHGTTVNAVACIQTLVKLHQPFVTNAITNFLMTMLSPMLWLLSIRKSTNLVGRCSNIHHTVRTLHLRTFICLVPWRNSRPAIAVRQMQKCHQLFVDVYTSIEQTSLNRVYWNWYHDGINVSRKLATM